MDCGSKPVWCAGLGAVVILLLALVVGLLVFVIVQRNKELHSKNEQKPLLSDKKTNLETGIAMSGALTFAPMTGAFMIPFEQLEVGQVIAVGAQGQVRRGIFSGKAVAIKELLSVMFNPEETTALKVRSAD